MKTILTLFILLTPWLLAAQNTTGQIIDEGTTMPLPYVNIGVVGAGRGTVSDEDGNFSLNIPGGLDQRTLKLSILGYESLSFTVAEFRQQLRSEKKIYLKPVGINLQEIVVVPKFNQTRRIGNKATARKLTDGFDGDALGREGGIIVKLADRYRPAVVLTFRAYVDKNPYEEIKFRLNFYTLKKGLPYKSIPQKSIIVTSKIKSGVLEVDLEPYDIVLKEDFAITLEWIEDFGDNNWNNGLRFTMRRFGPKCVFRYASQDSWSAYSGLLAPSPCMNVTVGYK
jgi:hypothetical protein